MLIALMLVSTLFSLLIRGWAGGLGAKANFLIDAILVSTSLGVFGSQDRTEANRDRSGAPGTAFPLDRSQEV